MPRTKSSQNWLRRHVNDPFVRRAQREGSRSRATYKLIEIDQRDRLFQPGMKVVDLGAAPGGFAQYASRQIAPGGRVYAVDLLPMKSIEGVEFIQGDFSESTVLDLLLEQLGDKKVDLVMSDLAPNITGIRASDQAKSLYLAELVVDFVDRVLRPGGILLLKTFQGAGFRDVTQWLRPRFATLAVRKPKASRVQSAEVYFLAKGFKVGSI